MSRRTPAGRLALLLCLHLCHAQETDDIAPPPASPWEYLEANVASVLGSLVRTPLIRSAIVINPETSPSFVLDNPFDPSSRSNGTTLVLPSWLPSNSSRVISRADALAAMRTTSGASTNDVLMCALNGTLVTKCVAIPTGQNISDLNALGLAAAVPLVDIPATAFVEVFQYPNFRGARHLRNATTPLVVPLGDFGEWVALMNPGSLRVWSSGEAIVELLPSLSSDVVFYSNYTPNSPSFAVKANESVPSLMLLYELFQLFIYAVDVAPSVVLFGFDQPSYQGNITTYPSAFYSLQAVRALIEFSTSIESFQVRGVNDIERFPVQQTPLTNSSATCSRPWQTNSLATFTVGIEYDMLHPLVCNITTLQIPPGLAVVGFDRPWRLGKTHVWIGNAEADSWDFRLRSLQVVPIMQVLPQLEAITPSSPHANDYVSIYSVEPTPRQFASFEVGTAVPAVAKWESLFGPLRVHVPPGLIFTVYKEYNFQGETTNLDRDGILKFGLAYNVCKSFRVLRQSDATFANTFVGFYTPWPNNTPLFLQPGDAIRALLFPWTGSINKLTIPNGTVALGFSETGFKGYCQQWSADTTLPAPWNRSIRSIQAWFANDTRGYCTNRPLPPPAMSSESPAAPFSLSATIAISITLAIALMGSILWIKHIKKPTPAKGQTIAINSPEYDILNWGDLDILRLYKPSIHVTANLASGASGRISLGTYQHRQVAIKTMLSNNPSPAQVQKFIDEIQFLGGLKSPYIVTLIGAAWTHPTNLQCVMEYMNRGDLRHVLAHTTSPANWPWSAKLDVAHSVAQALFYLHSQQMIHRDLKSRNVLLDSKKGTKLADFGTSKQHVYEGDSMTAGVGTFRWMAPEMLLFQPYSNAVDVYSFGVLLSELATHTLPYA
ncbi:hypothetical protein As57867_016671, partial [Aphanomyces stellatus]